MKDPKCQACALPKSQHPVSTEAIGVLVPGCVGCFKRMRITGYWLIGPDGRDLNDQASKEKRRLKGVRAQVVWDADEPA